MIGRRLAAIETGNAPDDNRGIKISADGKGRCLDNIFVERLRRSLAPSRASKLEDEPEAMTYINRQLSCGAALALLLAAACNAPSQPDGGAPPRDVRGDFYWPSEDFYWPSEPPPPLPRDAGGPLRVIALHLRQLESCALLDDGRVACWGYLAAALPKIMPLMHQARGLANGRIGLCAVVRGGDVRCLGPLVGPQQTPRPWVRHTPALPPIVTMDYSEHHGCALDAIGKLRCWGANYAGELGVGRPGGWHDARVVPLPAAVTDFSVGYDHTCACTVSGDVYCWGRDLHHGALGLPVDHPDRRTCGTAPYAYPCVVAPARVPGLAGSVGIASHGDTTCAWSAGGEVSCWGQNSYGLLGLGHDHPVAGPQRIPNFSGVRRIAFGGNGLCALLDDGRVACWGSNVWGEIGSGSFDRLDPCFEGAGFCATRPRLVPDIEGAVDLAYGGNHVCALLTDGRIGCWGRGTQGQLGHGLMEDRASPVWVHGFERTH